MFELYNINPLRSVCECVGRKNGWLFRRKIVSQFGGPGMIVGYAVYNSSILFSVSVGKGFTFLAFHVTDQKWHSVLYLIIAGDFILAAGGLWSKAVLAIVHLGCEETVIEFSFDCSLQ